LRNVFDDGSCWLATSSASDSAHEVKGPPWAPPATGPRPLARPVARAKIHGQKSVSGHLNRPWIKSKSELATQRVSETSGMLFAARSGSRDPQSAMGVDETQMLPTNGGVHHRSQAIFRG
jgi:hypothetical protein